MEFLTCYSNSLTELDLSANSLLTYLKCYHNNLTRLNVKNGNNSNFSTFEADNNNLTCITVDNVTYSQSNWPEIDEGVVFSLNCDADPPVIDEVTLTNIECPGDFSGSIEIAASGGEGTLVYSVNNGSDWQVSGLFPMLQAGIYNIKVKDANENFAIWAGNPDTLTEPAYSPLVIDEITASRNINGTWNLTVLASGGIPTYSYKINNEEWQTSTVFENLHNDADTFYVQGSNGCITSTIFNPIVYIPDINLKTYFVANTSINKNGDSEIQITEAESITTRIDVGSKSISDMTGIEYFVNLKELCCYNNLLTKLDVSNNVQLTSLVCWNNSITELNLSANTFLQTVDCWLNDLTELDLFSNSALTTLRCYNNSLNKLDLRNGNNSNLTTLNCTGNTSLTCVSVDDVAYSEANWGSYFEAGVIFSTDCEAPPLIDTIELIHINCYGDETGGITITATGGIGTLSYSIDNGSTWNSSSSFSNLEAGNYYIKVKDETEAIAAWTDNPVIITQPAQLTFDTIEITHDDGTGNGSITLTISEGTPPYSYRINEGEWQSSNSFTGLSAGTYTVGVKDVTLCQNSTDAIVEPPVVFIPDAAFKAALVANPSINTNSDSEIQVSEAESFTGTINVSGMNISDMTGIESFIKIIHLYCYNNLLSELNVSANTLLISLNCSTNSLTMLDISANTLLISFSCYDNPLTTLDVSANTLLTKLYCYNNQLSELDVSENTDLDALICRNNLLTEIDISQNTSLVTFSCYDNFLTALDVSNNNLLELFYCDDNQLTTLDLRNNNLLNDFMCTGNNLTSLDLRNGNNELITYITCTGNPELTCISVDDVDYAVANWTDDFDPGVTFSLNCSSGIPEDYPITDTSFDSGETNCYGATQTITVGGDGNNVNFNVGSATTLIAGTSITFLPGVNIYEGSYLSATITSDNTFCYGATPSLVEAKVETKKSEAINDNQKEISETIHQQSLKVFPNPNNGKFHVELNGFSSSVEIFICNYLGSTIYKGRLDSENTSIDLSGIQKGIYFIKIINSQKPLIQKIIVN